MTSTYETIRALPAKGFDWTGFNAALRALTIGFGKRSPQSGTLAQWDGAKGMREIRCAAMEMAAYYSHEMSIRSNIIAPSSESKMWDSFEGGHHDVWHDATAKEAAAAHVAALASQFRG